MALPIEYDTVNVYREYVNLDGTVPTGTVEFAGKIRARAVTSGKTILPTTIVAPIDADGRISVNLPATDDPDISPHGNWTYTVTEKFTRGTSGAPFELVVPIAAKTSGIDLGSYLPPDTPPSGSPDTYVTMAYFQSVFTGAVLLSRAANGTWPARPSNVTHVTWVETLPGTAKVPPAMASGDLYVGPDGMGGLAPGALLP
jgi:hypothetical protein